MVQHGVGPGPFAEMIRTFHVRRHEQLHLQYLEMVHVRLLSPVARLLEKFEPFGAFDGSSVAKTGDRTGERDRACNI